MNNELMMRTVMDTLAGFETSKIARIDLQNYDLPDGTKGCTVNFAFRKDHVPEDINPPTDEVLEPEPEVTEEVK